MEHPSLAFLDSRRPSESPFLSVLNNLRNGTPLTNGLLPVESQKKVTVSRFLPLPAISASPISTPTTSISPQPLATQTARASSSDPSSKYTSHHTTSLPPTWISTPPTPPPRMVRRSVTCSARPSSAVCPSASFPPSTPRANGFLKRRVSLPPLSLQSPSALVTSLASGPLPSREGCIIDSFSTTGQSTFDLSNTAGRSAEAARRPKPIFHIPRDPFPDSENTASPPMTASPELMHKETSADSSPNDAHYDRVCRIAKVKDDLRKYHALKELLSTEVGYLLDLRALVTVYLRILPTLVYRPPASFGRPSSSFTSSPWINSYAHTYTAVPSSTSFSDSSVTSYANMKDPTKNVSRYLFTDQEIEVLTRNAEEMLHLHEHFVQELRAEVAPLGYDMETKPVQNLEESHRKAMQNIDAAIRTVSTKFATEASRFASYETFCTGHPEALDLVRKMQSQRPLEWDAFEQRCSSLLHELELTPSGDPEVPEPAGSSEESDPVIASPAIIKKRSRAASLSSIDGAVRTIRPRGARLMFDDYLIKPVQRICKYPLMLDQLKQGKSSQTSSGVRLPTDVDVIVESAAQAMRHVARAVDEARHRQDVAVRSSLIISRISLINPVISQPPHSIPQSLTRIFLTSLGTCFLAGSLDVIHCHAAKPSSANFSAKYLGAFLYLGGYIIFVKVLKSKVYEPKHWFSLADFDVCGLEEDDALLPCSIRLTSKEHRFELAAACQREKDAWLDAIRESRKHQPSWVNEPNSSLRVDGKGDLIPSALDDGPFELVNALPTIQSIPELLNNPEAQLTQTLFSAFSPEIKQKKSPKPEPTAWRHESEPPSRRSSTASMKAIFSPAPYDSETIVIRRSSASARSRVDLGLQDVISQLCLTARSYASSRDEELFQAPKSTGSGFARSQSGISMAGMAKSRLTRHESVRVTRRKSFVDGSDKLLPRKSSSTGQCISSRRQSSNLNITPFPASEGRTSISSPHSPTSPSPHSLNTTRSSMILKSPSHSPTILEAPALRSSPPPHVIKSQLKSSRSLVSNVKGFFSSRSSSPGSLSQPNETLEVVPRPAKTRTPGSIGHWARGSLHRRTRSVPNEPDEPSFTLPKLPALDFGAPMSTPSADYESHLQVVPCLYNHGPPTRKSRFSSPCGEMDKRHTTAQNIHRLQRTKA